MNAAQRARTYSDDIKPTKAQQETFGEKIEEQKARTVNKTNNR